MNLLKFFLNTLLLFGPLSLWGQFELPKIDYDSRELIEKKEEKIKKRVFSKSGQVVLEVHYPIAGSIQSYCHRSNVVYDSVYIYYGDERVEVKFNKNNRGITKSRWREPGRLLYTEIYHNNGQLSQKYSQYTQLDESNPSPRCAQSFMNYHVGEFFSYSEDGTLVQYKNYNTGKTKPKEKAYGNNQRELKRLQDFADKILQENYGKSFFNRYIRLNYFLTGAYHAKSASYHRNKGLPDVRLYDGWFQQWEEPVTYADFSYDIVFSEEERYALIRIRVDKDGNLVEAVDKSTSSNQAFTKGLLSQPVSRLASKKEIVDLAVTKGLDINDPDLNVALKWKEEGQLSSKGTLKYELTFDKMEKKVWGCRLYNFEKWEIDPASMEVDMSGEVQSGECMASMTRVSRGAGNKYGVSQEFSEEPLISYSYEYLQPNMAYFLIAKKNGKYGLIDHEENVLLPFEFDLISWLRTSKKRYKDEYCSVKKNGEYGLYSKEGKKILEGEYQSIRVEGDTIIAQKDEGVVVFDMRTGAIRK
jgi:hypothetical protein